MKIRKGFVSNSSSSSFICISDEGKGTIPIIRDGVLTIPRKFYNERDFVYGTYESFGDKLNFLYLQVLQRDDNFYYQKLLNFLKRTFEKEVEHFHLEERLFLEDDYYSFIREEESGDGYVEGTPYILYGHIDHGAIFEDEDFEKVFESDETLFNFLFKPSSYVEITRD